VTEDKMDVPKGLWYKSPRKNIDADELTNFQSPEDGFHVRIGSSTYFEILFDNNEFVELDKNLIKILCTLLTQRNMQTD
jgi:acetyl-CoA carboxylase carboxyl transferase subunit beta